jgi:hypothetical protein
LTVTGVDIVIGGTPVRIAADDEGFRNMLLDRYADFIGPLPAGDPIELMPIELTIDLTPNAAIHSIHAEDDLSVFNEAGIWVLRRGDFQARYDPVRRQGVIQQSVIRQSVIRQSVVRQGAHWYGVDAVLRIVHSIVLAGAGGFLLHAASAIRGNRAFIFAGRSGAGKTTIARLAPADVSLLSDEISWVSPARERFFAWGTPFTGELGRPGVNRSAPVAALYFLEQARENRITRLEGAETLRLLLENILFFADDPRLVRRVFDNACAFAASTSVFRLSFLPHTGVWELIR